MKKLVCIFVCLLFVIQYVYAQELTVKSMMAAPMDLSASQYERKDLAGKSCGLVKVQLASAGARFEGNVIGQVEYKTGEYWVFMTEGSYMLTVKHPNFVPLDVNFRDYGISKVQSKATYKLTVLMPQSGNVVQTQKLTINYTPADAIVLVDSKPYQDNGHLELTLPVGSHDYQVVAVGYGTVEGSVKLNADAPRTVTENLVAIVGASPREQAATPIVPQASQEESEGQSVPLSQSDNFPFTPSVPVVGSVETVSTNGVSFQMVRVEGGTFLMGATEEQGNEAWDNEMPVHQVTLSDYSIGETEVTQELWKAVMGSNPSNFKGKSLPVESVSWDDCQAFITKLNSLTGRRFRLPTEAEWEYAARGGKKGKGYKYSGSNAVDGVAWHVGNSGSKIHAVGMKQPNELGLYDMSGNVWEWCQDWFGSYDSGSQINSSGSGSGSRRVLRGGRWASSSRYCRVSCRRSSTPDDRASRLGLRLAL